MLSEDNVLGPTSGHAVVPPQQAVPGVAGPVSGDPCCRPPDGSKCDPNYLSPGPTYWRSPQYEAFLSQPKTM